MLFGEDCVLWTLAGVLEYAMAHQEDLASVLKRLYVGILSFIEGSFLFNFMKQC